MCIIYKAKNVYNYFNFFKISSFMYVLVIVINKEIIMMSYMYKFHFLKKHTIINHNQFTISIE